jgi:BirA family biotin operon repressor/biotin-[acetyl-CoA-carboxylase] ligase
MALELGVSRTAIWKALEKLAALGIEVETLRGRGYRLTEPLELLDAARIRSALSPWALSAIDEIEIHTSITSTNSHLMQLGKTTAVNGRVCLAEHQDQGRGRHGRTWVSPFGRGILLSVLWRFSFGLAGLAGLSLAVGAATAAALQDRGIRDIALKWPNDLLWQGRKLAGLLLEAAGEAHGPSYAVVGLGVNLNLSPHQMAQIAQPCVDLATALPDGRLDRNRLTATLIEALVSGLDRFAREGLAPFLPIWNALDRYRGHSIVISVGDRETTGIHAGIAPDGSLRLRTPTGEELFQAGEVSLRPATPGE